MAVFRTVIEIEFGHTSLFSTRFTPAGGLSPVCLFVCFAFFSHILIDHV